MLVLRLLIGSPVQEDADAALLRGRGLVNTFLPSRCSKLIFPYLPCCTGQKCEVQCFLRRFETWCLLRKTADAPSAGRSRSDKPFNFKTHR